MSALTDSLSLTLKPICDAFFHDHAHEYDLSHKDGCGKYTEALVRHMRALGYVKVGLLKKTGGTMYNGHSIDGFLYREGDPTLYRHVDFIGGAESANAYAGWSIDDPRYIDSDWMAEPQSQPSNTVPWVPYDENSFQTLKKELAYDYARRPQGADFDVSVWSARVFHNAYMGPNKTPLGMTAGIDRAKKEWSAALGVPFQYAPAGWNIGEPV